MRDLEKEIVQALARGYCSERNAHKMLDSDLIEDMCEEVVKIIRNPTSPDYDP